MMRETELDSEEKKEGGGGEKRKMAVKRLGVKVLPQCQALELVHRRPPKRAGSAEVR